MLDQSNLWDGERHPNSSLFKTEAGRLASRLMAAHTADIILALKCHAFLLIGEDKDRSDYLFRLSDDLYTLIKVAESEL